MGIRSIGFISRSIYVHVTDNIGDRIYRGLFTSPIQVFVDRLRQTFNSSTTLAIHGACCWCTRREPSEECDLYPVCA